MKCLRTSLVPLALGTLITALALTATAAPERQLAQKSKNPVATIQTSMGAIEVELFRDKAPRSVANFISYAKSGIYNGTIFHRVIKGFMIQGGGFDTQLNKRPVRAPIKNEATNGLTNKRGTLAMARTGVVDSATNQFFINVVDNAFLNHRSLDPRGYGYAVFGEVRKGLEVVERIRAVPTGACGTFRKDCPQTQVVITQVTIK